MHAWQIIDSISALSTPGINDLPSLASSSSDRRAVLHSSPTGGGKQHSFRLTRPDRNLTHSLEQVCMDPRNFNGQVLNKVFGCVQFDTGSIRYLWVVQGSLKTFLYCCIACGEYPDHFLGVEVPKIAAIEGCDIQWDKCKDSNCEDSIYTKTSKLSTFLAMYVVLYIP